MTNVIETVARAIQNDDGSPCISTMRLGLCKQADGCVCRSLARAALLALREPTLEMIEAGCECDAFDKAVWSNKRRHEELRAKYPSVPERTRHGAAPIQFLPEVWKAMLDAALQTDGEAK